MIDKAQEKLDALKTAQAHLTKLQKYQSQIYVLQQAVSQEIQEVGRQMDFLRKEVGNELGLVTDRLNRDVDCCAGQAMPTLR